MKQAVKFWILCWYVHTLAFVSAGEVEYRYYRFTPTQLRVTNNCCVQLAEFEFLREGVRVGTQFVSNPGGRNPSNKTPDLSVDELLSTKWLDFNQGSLLFDFGSPKKVDSYRWATANDATERDPVQWRLEGSDDETSWVLVDERVGVDFPTPVPRLTPFLPNELRPNPFFTDFPPEENSCWRDLILKVRGGDPLKCPCCPGTMKPVRTFR